MPNKERITRLLNKFAEGDTAALDEMLPLVYDELRRAAGEYLARESSERMLQPTALLDDAYTQLFAGPAANSQSRARFYGLAANMMRQILVNHAGERSGPDGMTLLFEGRSLDLLDVDEALSRLSELDPRMCRVVEMKFFSGMTTDEIAEVTGRSPRSVERNWTFARSWLFSRLLPGPVV